MVVLPRQDLSQREDEKDPFAQSGTSSATNTLTAGPTPSELRHFLP